MRPSAYLVCIFQRSQFFSRMINFQVRIIIHIIISFQLICTYCRFFFDLLSIINFNVSCLTLGIIYAFILPSLSLKPITISLLAPPCELGIFFASCLLFSLPPIYVSSISTIPSRSYMLCLYDSLILWSKNHADFLCNTYLFTQLQRGYSFPTRYKKIHRI